MTSLALLQLVSPALPVGSFGYSEGLEVLVQASALCNASDVEHWLRAELQRGSIRIEAASLRFFFDDFARWKSTGDSFAHQSLIELDRWLLSMRDASELRAQQCQMGMALIALMAEMGYPCPNPVIVLAGSLGVGGVSPRSPATRDGGGISIRMGGQSAQCRCAAGASRPNLSSGVAAQALTPDQESG